MYIIKFMKGPYNDLGCIYRVIHYIFKDKVAQGHVRFFGGFNIDDSKEADQMLLVKQYFHKIDNRMLRHF